MKKNSGKEKNPGTFGLTAINILCVTIGSALGSVARFYLSFFSLFFGFPGDTVAVNLLGCFVFGFFNEIFIRNRSSSIFLETGRINFLRIGFLGSFTTFSTFIFESVVLGQENFFFLFLYFFTSVIGGFLLLFTGEKIAAVFSEMMKTR